MSDGGDKKPEPRSDIFKGVAIVTGILLALVLANMAMAGIEYIRGDGFGWKSSDSVRAQAFQEAADMIGDVAARTDRVIEDERTGDVVRRTDARCVDPAARFTEAVLEKIRTRLERKARNRSVSDDDSVDRRRRGCRRASNNKCPRRGEDDYPEALK